MLSESYLIAHKVRGEPTFDIAQRMVCPLCSGQGCAECDDAGYWWIVGTSGRRAYPYWYISFTEMDSVQSGCIFAMCPVDMPPDFPDHYPLRHSPSNPHVDILSLLPKAAKPTIRRRL